MDTCQTLKIVTWQQIKKKIAKLNPLLAQQINKIKGVDTFKLLQVRYSFGEKIIDRGEFRISFHGENLPINHPRIPKEIRSILNYHWKASPLGIVSHNSIESYINHSSHIIPYRLLLPGKVFSILSIFDTLKFSDSAPKLRSTSSGSRSLIFLPKITHQESHARLAIRYKTLQKQYPKKTHEHWEFFKRLAQAEEKIFTEWYSEVLFFGKDFLSCPTKTESFRHFLLNSVWMQESFRRNEGLYDFIISALLTKMPASLRKDPEIFYHFKHIIKIALREAPGFIPASNDVAAPIKELGNIMLNYYRLRFHYPVFLQLAHYDGKAPVYYSLQHPMYLYEIPKGRREMQFTINKLKKIKRLFILFRDFVLSGKFEHNIEDTLLYQMLKYTDFDFFHPKDPSLSGSTEKMVSFDKRFWLLINRYWKNRKLSFPYHAIFLNGVIRIKPKTINNKIWEAISKYY